MSAYLPLAQPIGIGSGGPHTAQVSLTVFGLLLLLVLLASSELGYRVGSRGSRLPDQARISQNLTWQAGVLGLLGLLVGFSFAMAVSRFDARRELILEEANAIGTTYLRTHLIDPRAGEELRGLLRRYVHVRVAFYEAGTDRGRIEQSQRSSSALQEEIWSRVAAIGRADRHDVMTSLLVQATNDSFDLEAKRRTALENHVPITVFVVLVLVASTAMASIGFTCGLTGRRFWFGMLFMPLLIAAVVFLVFDIDRPRTGLIRAGEQSMIRLEQSL